MFQKHTSKGYFTKVLTKLQKLPEHVGKSDHELCDLVNTLTDVEPFRESCDCFRAVVEEPSKGFTLEASAGEQEQLQCKEGLKDTSVEYERICKFPVKLVLYVKPTSPSRVPSGGIVKGPLHAALLISDHLFEWDERSLVIPRKVDLTKQPALITGFLNRSEWFAYVTEKRSKLEIASPQEFLYGQEVDIAFDLAAKKETLIESVITVFVDYNRNKKYHHKKCNNRHFIGAVAEGLGIKTLPAFGTSLKRQLEKSKKQCSRGLSRIEFTTHAELDAHTTALDSEDMKKLTTVDLEYLAGKYFYFHVLSWEQSPAPDQWSCQEEDCQLPKIETQLEKCSHS